MKFEVTKHTGGNTFSSDVGDKFKLKPYWRGVRITGRGADAQIQGTPDELRLLAYHLMVAAQEKEMFG